MLFLVDRNDVSLEVRIGRRGKALRHSTTSDQRRPLLARGIGFVTKEAMRRFEEFRRVLLAKTHNADVQNAEECEG